MDFGWIAVIIFFGLIGYTIFDNGDDWGDYSIGFVMALFVFGILPALFIYFIIMG